MRRDEEFERDLDLLVSNYKYLRSEEVVNELVDGNNHGLGGLEDIFNDALRSSVFNNWTKGRLGKARQILQKLMDADSKGKELYARKLKEIQSQIDK